VECVGPTKLQDIADALGVSVSTVSRALSGNGRVGEKTRKKILEAVREADYMPNAVARSLRLRDTKNVGVIVPDIANSFYASIIKGAQQVCRERGYALTVCNSDEDIAMEEEALQIMLEKQISGLILATVGCSAESISHYKRLGIPVVFIDNMPAQGEVTDSVSIDNFGAAYRLTQELINRGYTKIGAITGPLSQSTGRLRYTGYMQAMEDAALVPQPAWIVSGDFRFESGYKLMRVILRLSEKPDAMLISNNYMTYGAINALREAGAKVPHDVAIAAFDAEDHTGLIQPLIASVNQPAFEIGEKSAEIIVKRLLGDSDSSGNNLVLEPTLCDGNSW